MGGCGRVGLQSRSALIYQRQVEKLDLTNWYRLVPFYFYTAFFYVKTSNVPFLNIVCGCNSFPPFSTKKDWQEWTYYAQFIFRAIYYAYNGTYSISFAFIFSLHEFRFVEPNWNQNQVMSKFQWITNFFYWTIFRLKHFMSKIFRLELTSALPILIEFWLET